VIAVFVLVIAKFTSCSNNQIVAHSLTMMFIYKFHDHTRLIIDFASRYLCDLPYFEVTNRSFYWIGKKRFVSGYQKK
jgi:hypothetical protein